MGNLRERIAQSLRPYAAALRPYTNEFTRNPGMPILTGLGTGVATYALTGLGKNKGKNRLLRALIAGVAGTGAGYGMHNLQDMMNRWKLRRLQADAYEDKRRREGDEEDARIQDAAYAHEKAMAEAAATSSDPPQEEIDYEFEDMIDDAQFYAMQEHDQAVAELQSPRASTQQPPRKQAPQTAPTQRATNETFTQANKGQAFTGTGNAGNPANLSYSDIIEQKENADKMQREQYKNTRINRYLYK